MKPHTVKENGERFKPKKPARCRAPPSWRRSCPARTFSGAGLLRRGPFPALALPGAGPSQRGPFPARALPSADLSCRGPQPRPPTASFLLPPRHVHTLQSVHVALSRRSDALSPIRGTDCRVLTNRSQPAILRRITCAATCLFPPRALPPPTHPFFVFLPLPRHVHTLQSVHVSPSQTSQELRDPVEDLPRPHEPQQTGHPAADDLARRLVCLRREPYSPPTRRLFFLSFRSCRGMCTLCKVCTCRRPRKVKS